MSKEVVHGEPLSGVDFIDGLNDLWGGELFLSINPEIRDKLSDVRPFVRKALFGIFHRQKQIEGYTGGFAGIFDIPVSSDMVEDFGKIVVQGMPYESSVVDGNMVISNIFCRTVLVVRLEEFFRSGIKDFPDGGFIIDDLPVPIVLSEVLFETEEVFPDFRSQIGETYMRAEELSDRFPFGKVEKKQWVEGFQAGLKTMDAVHEVVSRGQGYRLHPALWAGYSSALNQHRKALRKKNR